MSENTLPAEVRADIQGDVSGQVAVGSYIVQVGSVHGGVVNITAPGQTPASRPRPSPVILRPRPFPGLIGRTEEINTVKSAFRDGMCVDLLGEQGLGKTALVRSLVHQASTDQFTNGIVYLSARNQLPVDVLQSIYDSFYECDTPFKPTESQLRHAFQTKNALIVLDDVEQERDDLESLISIAPSSTFVFCSSKRRVWREIQGLPVHGLKPIDAIALIEREIGRELTPEEHAAAESLCTTLGGHPLRLIQEAARVRDEGASLASLAAENRGSAPSQSHDNHAVASQQQPQQNALAAMAALGGATLTPEALAAIAQLTNAAAAIQSLQNGFLAQANSPRYNLTGSLATAVEKSIDLAPFRDRALEYFADWAESEAATPESLRVESEGIMQSLAWGASSGRHAEVLRLGRAIETTLIERGHWDAWQQTIEWNLAAARALQDPAAEARAIHQQGTRLLCLGDKKFARTLLLQALTMRMSLGDKVGAAVTRHHLDVIEIEVKDQKVPHGNVPPPPATSTSGKASTGGRRASGAAALSNSAVIVLSEADVKSGHGGSGASEKCGKAAQAAHGVGSAISSAANFAFKAGLAVAAVVGLAAGGMYARNRVVAEMSFNTCMANAKALGNALAMYGEDNDDTMVPAYTGASEADSKSWPQILLPFLERSERGKPDDAKKALLCPSFDLDRVATNLQTDDCMERDALGSYRARERQADYGLGVGAKGGNCTPESPYFFMAGSGPEMPGMKVSNVARTSGTVILTDGFTGVLNDSGSSMRSVFGCASQGSHKDGGIHLFLDWHAKFLSKNSESVTSKDSSGCTYKTYYTTDR